MYITIIILNVLSNNVSCIYSSLVQPTLLWTSLKGTQKGWTIAIRSARNRPWHWKLLVTARNFISLISQSNWWLNVSLHKTFSSYNLTQVVRCFQIVLKDYPLYTARLQHVMKEIANYTFLSSECTNTHIISNKNSYSWCVLSCNQLS